jgi:hypothetical protein
MKLDNRIGKRKKFKYLDLNELKETKRKVDDYVSDALCERPCSGLRYERKFPVLGR